MNVFKLLDKNKLLNERAKTITENILKETVNIDDDISTYKKIWTALSTIYKSSGKPLFEPIEAKKVPIKEDYMEMVRTALNDMEILNNECSLIDEYMTNIFKDSEMQKEMFKSNIKYTDDFLSKIQKEASSLNIQIISENFSKNINNSRIEEAAYINTKNGYLSLYPLKSTTADGLKASINNSSNGFPGNTHIANIVNGEIKFDGEVNLNNDLNNLTDGRYDTYFEYESILVSEDVIEKTNGYGFNYYEGDSFISESDKLILSLKLDVNRECNFLILTPFIPEDKEAAPAFIENIQLYNGNELIEEHKIRKLFDQKYVLIFENTFISHMNIDLAQAKPYEKTIGHIYYYKLNKSFDSVFDNIGHMERVDGYNPSKRLLVEDGDKDLLFYPTVSSENILGGIELLDAKRYSIGIRSIDVSEYAFLQRGEYISDTYKFNHAIKSIYLEAEEFIPKSFKGFEAFIKYYISIDEGESYYPILPKHKAYMTYEYDKSEFNGLTPYAYYNINSEEQLEFRRSNAGYIDTILNPNSIKIKIVLTRPIDEKFISMSPIVFSYKINIGMDGYNYEV